MLYYILSLLPYYWMYWWVEYLENWLKIVVGVTLIWRETVAANKILAIEFELHFLNLENSPLPNKPCVQYVQSAVTQISSNLEFTHNSSTHRNFRYLQ